MFKILTREELERMMERNEDFVLVDVSSPESYERGHIPGAINIPLEEIEKKAGKVLNRRERIFVYSRDSRCSHEAARKLVDLGFARVWDYEGGLEDWREGGYPVIGSGKVVA